MWNLVVAAGVACLGAAGMALAEPLEEIEHKRTHDPLSAALWSAPPAGADDDVIYSEAQWGSPDAPFVFLGDTLHVGGSFESGREVLIGEQARIDVREGATLRLSGTIGNDRGSRQGLVKLGAGTLELSGANTYQGNTLLLEGGLKVSGNEALGSAARTLNVNTGTVLEYAPGVVVSNAVQLQAEDMALHAPAEAWAMAQSMDEADRVQWVVAGGEAMQAGMLAGTAPFVKRGAGRLRIADGLAYGGQAFVGEGALAVDGVFYGSVAVQRQARLEGTGSVASAVVQPGGVLAPGAAGGGIGTLRVQGDLVLQPGAHVEVDASPLGAVDQLWVGGKALLDGDLVVLAQAGDWRTETRYTVLRAEQGLDGSRFASVGSNFAFLTPVLGYDERQVYLGLRRNDVPFEDIAEDPTQEEVASAVEQDGPSEAGQGPGLYEQIVGMDGPQAREAFRQLSGSWHASLWSSMVEDSRYVRQAVLAHAHRQAAEYIAAPATGPDEPLHFWSRAYHSSADRAGMRGVPGDQRDLQGLVLGATRDLAGGAALGAYMGVQRSRVRRAAGMADARIDSTHAGMSLAGRWRAGRYALGAGYSWHRVRSARKVDVGSLQDDLRGGYRAGLFQAFGEWSLPLALTATGIEAVAAADVLDSAKAGTQAARAVAIEPFARLAWVRADTRGHVETGSAAALDVRPAGTATWFGSLGLRATRAIVTPAGHATIQAALAWRRAGGDLRAVSRQSFRDSARHTVFESEGQPIRRDAWTLELGLQAALGRNADLALGYAGQFGSGASDHGARLSLAWRF